MASHDWRQRLLPSQVCFQEPSGREARWLLAEALAGLAFICAGLLGDFSRLPKSYKTSGMAGFTW